MGNVKLMMVVNNKHIDEGCKLYIGLADCTIFLWGIQNLQKVTTVWAHHIPVCMQVSLHSMLFTGFLKAIKVWNILVTKLKLKKELMNLNHCVWALVATQSYLNPQWLLPIKIWDIYTLTESFIHMWDMESNKKAQTLTGYMDTMCTPVVILRPYQTSLQHILLP
ncbi:hypothetical protein MC885_009436 [Smutsia gigantea]|nr:hypothetical protein MC885_009436 [Smutsia gigantea]